MLPLLSLAYGLVAYTVFQATFIYAIGFVTGIAVPKTVDVDPLGFANSTGEAVVINLLLLTVFAIQHSVMARKPFKRWVTQYVPATIERSTYVLVASLALALVLWQWRPIPMVVWDIGGPVATTALTALSLFGFFFALISTFLINHFELFGLSQVMRNLMGRDTAAPQFRTPLLYKVVRHPLYLGFLIAFWSAPVMTAGHLLFAAATTGYILLGIALEERDLVDLFGDEYRRYRQRVAMLVPFSGRSS